MPDPCPQRIFDRRDIRRFRNRSRNDFARYDFLVQNSAQSLSDRLCDIRRQFDTAAIDGPCPFTHPSIRRSYHIGENAPCDIVADNEVLPFAGHSLNLFASILTLHTANDLPGALVQIRRSLTPDGLFLAALFGGETLFELRDAMTRAELATRGGVSPRVFPFADKQQMGSLLQRAGFALPVVDSDLITVTYRDLRALMHDLRGMGQSNAIAARDRRNPGKALFTEAERIYRKAHADEDGRLRATFEIIYLIGWAPHESQQKPLRPGSATARLADALGTNEHNVPTRRRPTQHS
ncbi:MAG: SAM-dependent methyltransferase [Alphaproteobacteria bacterium]|nr:SAM-dependent methyltransferase [Alphaproteobacteria bacterium]